MTNAELIEAARTVCNPMKLSIDEFTCGEVGAALLTASGNVYTGICIDLACGLGFCAEASAIAEMLKNQETQIIRMVAYFCNGSLGTPCGRCREMIMQVDKRNADCIVVLEDDDEVTIRDLLPKHWLNEISFDS